MTEEEIISEIEYIKSKPTRSIYDFNKLRKLEKELEDERRKQTKGTGSEV